ncbi:MAG TPA: hypothetical protein VKI18_11605 [Albitalea sp.]|nr:hypothetical protein [Albitalea sp.]
MRSPTLIALCGLAALGGMAVAGKRRPLPRRPRIAPLFGPLAAENPAFVAQGDQAASQVRLRPRRAH